MHVDTILFDLDDTLFAYAPCNEAGLDAAHRALRATVDVDADRFRASHDQARGAFGRELAGQAASHNRVLFFKRMVATLAGRDEPATVLAMHQAYWDAFYDAMQPAPGAHELLDALARTYKLALVSNHVTEAQLGKVRRLDFVRHFPVIVTSEEIGTEKPDPAVFQAALDRLQTSPARAMMIGDSVSGDVRGALALGLTAVHTTQFTGDAPCAEAHHTIDALDQLRALLNV